MKLKDAHDAYLSRMSRRLSRDLGRSVSKREVLETLLSLAIADEDLFDPEAPELPITATRRAVVQSERTERRLRLEPHELLRILSAGSDLLRTDS